jgi:hypothetical protein
MNAVQDLYIVTLLMMQHTPYQVKYQFDIKGELKEAKYEPTIVDIKAKFQESIESLHQQFDSLTGANHDAEITVKLTVAKVSSWYYSTALILIDGAKYEVLASIDQDTPIENPMTMIVELHKKIVNRISHLKK